MSFAYIGSYLIRQHQSWKVTSNICSSHETYSQFIPKAGLHNILRQPYSQQILGEIVLFHNWWNYIEMFLYWIKYICNEFIVSCNAFWDWRIQNSVKAALEDDLGENTALKYSFGRPFNMFWNRAWRFVFVSISKTKVNS